jgi:hypothetical protein
VSEESDEALTDMSEDEPADEITEEDSAEESEAKVSLSPELRSSSA